MFCLLVEDIFVSFGTISFINLEVKLNIFRSLEDVLYSDAINGSNGRESNQKGKSRSNKTLGQTI